MFRKIGNGKLVWRDQEKNVSIGVFENRNAKNIKYGIVSIVALKGENKQIMEISIPEFKRIITIIERMPEIEVKK